MGGYSQTTYLSPYTWRYGSDAMRDLWSGVGQRRLWRRIWVALADAQCRAGIVSPEQVADLREHQDEVDWGRAQELEAQLRHDLMAEVRTFAEQCPIGGGIIHLGATSMDIEDNADALRLRMALDLVLERLEPLLLALVERIEAEADTVTMGYTHLQPAEPTTVGYRLSQYAQDLVADYRALQSVRDSIRGKGLKGAVGTSASYAHLLTESDVTPRELEADVMERLGLPAFEVATQTYPRKQDLRVLSALAGLAQSAHKLALDLRILQSPNYGEMSEPFGPHQVGSSAMPFKRNPIASENVCSLARYVASLVQMMWENAAQSALERTLDDSANRRTALPEAFLATDEILRKLWRIVEGLRINREAIARNMERYGPFAATEPLLMALVRAGASRQEMHERIRSCSMEAWAAVQLGDANPLVELLAADGVVSRYLTTGEVREVMAAGATAGDAPERSRRLAASVREALCSSDVE
jgi:adenylosuccinate lyase